MYRRDSRASSPCCCARCRPRRRCLRQGRNTSLREHPPLSPLGSQTCEGAGFLILLTDEDGPPLL